MAMQANSPEVIVVGGGIAGTSIAWRLAESGRRVLLLERRVQPEQPPLLGDFVALRSLWVKP